MISNSFNCSPNPHHNPHEGIPRTLGRVDCKAFPLEDHAPLWWRLIPLEARNIDHSVGIWGVAKWPRVRAVSAAAKNIG